MSLRSMKDTHFTTREIAELAIMAALMVVGKEALNFLPNIHPVMMLIILSCLVYKAKAFIPIIIFVAAEILIYGFGIWAVMYIYIWPLAAALCLIFIKQKSWIFWAIFAGVYGLLFGALCAIPYIFISGFPAAFAYWISGIPYDLIHGISNFVITIVLLPVLYKTIMRINNK